MKLKSKFSNIFYSLFLTILIFIPTSSWAGSAGFVDTIDQTDAGSSRIIAFWDTRGRASTFQVANITSSPVSVHVQLMILGDSSPCLECNFTDTLTPNDVHVYSLHEMKTNSSSTLVCEGTVGSDKYGFAVVSVSSGPSNSLIGVSRILDVPGKYEYRANMAGEDSSSDLEGSNVISFDNVSGHTQSDLIGITYVEVNADTIYASSGVSTIFGESVVDEILVYNDNEGSNQCGTTAFSCALGNMDKAINASLPNSKGGGNPLCANNIDSSGFVYMPFNSFECSDPIVGDINNVCQFTPHFVGFIGLNNGNGTGSFDSWWSAEDPVN